MDAPGKLIRQQSDVTYDACNLAHNAGGFHSRQQLPFEELDALITAAQDPKAAQYRGMTAANWRDYLFPAARQTVFPTLPFGSYFLNGSIRGDIHWYVLEIRRGTALLLSRFGLDSKPWHHENAATPWESSDLFRWLNGEFAVSAFSAQEQAAIVPLRKNSGLVTLLSQKETVQYLHGDGALTTQPTVAAINRGAEKLRSTEAGPQEQVFVGNGSWWLRDADDGHGAQVHWNGAFRTASMTAKKAMVRPLIRLDLEKAFGAKTAARLAEEYRTHGA